MKILMLSWEYPPKSVGGLSTHVYYLVHELSKLGHEVHLITCEQGEAPKEEIDNGIHIYRVTPYKLDTDDFIKWVMQLNFAMIELGSKLIIDQGGFELIHSHDWLTCFSSKVLKSSHNIPSVCTIHATEYGRNNGIKTDMQKYISSTERMLSYESLKVIVCSEYMKKQVAELFKTPVENIEIIPNGVNSKEFKEDFEFAKFRKNYAEEDEKIVFYIGRHVFEKGIHLLIEAALGILSGNNRTKFIIGGKGPMTEELKVRVEQLGISDRFNFLGYMEDEIRNKLYRVADVAVFPSLYEPFGIVALEAMSAGCPVVVSDTGGLAEIVKHEVNGMKCYSGSSTSLGDNILIILNNVELAKFIRENALKEIKEKYEWKKIAEDTVKVYEKVISSNK